VTTPLLTPVRAPGPRIRPSLRSTLPELPELPVAPGVSWFLVSEAGRFGERCWQRGEVLVCRGEARPGDTVVLVARGHGRPRIGRVDGRRFVGDQGEPCHPVRWASAGPIVGSLRPRSDGWVVDLGLPRRIPPPLTRTVRAPTQLRLPFAA